jgi:hypothetical protein
MQDIDTHSHDDTRQEDARPLIAEATLVARRVTKGPQVAFMHLPKTGGTSAVTTLQKHLPESAIQTIAFGIPEDPNNLDLSTLRDKSLLHGHFSARWAGLFDRTTPLAVCLREPRATTRSFYKYFLAFRPEDLTGRQALMRKSAVEGFKSYLQFMRNERASQHYVHYLDPLYGAPGHTALHGDALDKSVSRAKYFMDRCDIVGITEQIDSFVQSILTALEVPVERVQVEAVNVSVNLASEYPERFLPVAEADEQLDDETEALLQEINRPLIEIYEHAKARANG